MDYDVKSSIYRITYFLNTGMWPDGDVDFYEKMWGNKFENKDTRDLYKKFCMKLYFDKSPRTIYSHMLRRKEINPNFDKEFIISQIAEMKQNMCNVIGECYDSEIFLYESYMYSELARVLLDKGFKVIQIYDGFYVDKRMDENTFKTLCNNELIKISDILWKKIRK